MFLEKTFSEVKDEKKSSVRINLRFVSSLNIKIEKLKKVLKTEINDFDDESLNLLEIEINSEAVYKMIEIILSNKKKFRSKVGINVLEI